MAAAPAHRATPVIFPRPRRGACWDIHAVSTGSRHVPQATAACEERNTKVEARKRPVRFSDPPGRELYQVLHKAFDGSGIPWADCFCEDRGDGALIVVPPVVPCKGLIDPLPERLRGLIRRHNHVSRDAAGIQLRAAAHIGPVEYDGHGFVGTDINLLFRMLDARPLKAALAGSGAELGLIVSDYVYRNLVCRYPSLVSPDAFRSARFQVKYTRAQAWTYLPGAVP